MNNVNRIKSLILLTCLITFIVLVITVYGSAIYIVLHGWFLELSVLLAITNWMRLSYSYAALEIMPGPVI